MRDTLHIVDAGGLLHRSFHGAHAGTRRGAAAPAPLAGLRTLEAMVNSLVASLTSKRIVVCLDSSPSWRHEVYPEYKATRPPPVPELVEHLERGELLFAAMGLPVVLCEGFEADDLIADLTARARRRGWHVVIHATDKDLLQLVAYQVGELADYGGEVCVVDPVAKKTWRVHDVVEKYGVEPSQMADWLAMVGDVGDNVPGVAGCGEKTATKLLQEHGSLDALMLANPKVRGKYPFCVSPEWRQPLALSSMLVRLPSVRVPNLILDLEQLVLGKPTPATIRSLMTPAGVDPDDLAERRAIMEIDGGLSSYEAGEAAARRLTR